MSYNFLLIDDSALVRKSLKKTLAMSAVDVGNTIEAENGKEALKLMKENWVDMIFLDINMPVMDGIEFMQAYRSDDTLEDTPVVVISTEGSKERKELLQELDIAAYLRKPASPEVIAECVERILGASS